MADILIEALSADAFRVCVAGRIATTHEVDAKPGYVRQITNGHIDAETLVRWSFEFLLEREPNTSILRRFDLPVIGRYFPEYERHMRDRIARATA